MGFKLHLRLLLAASLVSGVSPTLGQTAPQPTVKIVEPPAPLLPKQFGAWQQTPDDPGFTPPDLGELGASTSSVLLEDGLAASSTATYKRDGTGESLLLAAYKFGDTTGAYSAFTFFTTPQFRPVTGVTLGMSALQDKDSVLIWSGPTVVKATFHGSKLLGELADLVAVLPKVGGPKGQPPLLPTFVPEKNLEARTLKYALGSTGYETMGGVLPASVVGFDKSAEVATMQYTDRGTLTMLLYPTPQIAGDHGRQIEAELNRQIASGRSFGIVKLRREGPLVLLTTGAWTPAEAKDIVEGTHLRDQLSWNKTPPLEFHAEVQKTASLLLSISELSGALMLAAVVMGLFFGGGRAAIRVLQGKPAATEPEFLAINLREGPGEGGSFKPLH
jgi:hypothetical protein